MTPNDKRRIRPLMNAANLLTLSRFALAPVVLWLILELRPAEHDPGAWKLSLAVLVLMILTALTDLFDGMVARAYKIVTNFGKIMDPVADSTFFMTVLFAFSAAPRFREDFPVWLPVLVLFREIAMHVLRRYAALRGIVLAAKTSGKAKTALQCVLLIAFALLLVLTDAGVVACPEHTLLQAAFWVGIVIVAVNLLSLIEYLRDVPELVREYRSDAEDHEG